MKFTLTFSLIIITCINTILFAQNSLTLSAISPFNINNLDENIIIPQDIIDVIDEQGLLNELNLEKNKNDDFIGILIIVAPDNPEFLLPDFKLRGEISIFDQEGNYVSPKNKMAWDDVSKSLLYVWNVKDEYGHYVNPGIYNCIIEIEEVTPSLYPNGGGPKQIKRTNVGVKGAGSDSCGSCGTSAELAFIPPIGFRIASMVKRRKKWWQRFFERFKSKVIQ